MELSSPDPILQGADEVGACSDQNTCMRKASYSHYKVLKLKPGNHEPQSLNKPETLNPELQP